MTAEGETIPLARFCHNTAQALAAAEARATALEGALSMQIAADPGLGGQFARALQGVDLLRQEIACLKIVMGNLAVADAVTQDIGLAQALSGVFLETVRRTCRGEPVPGVNTDDMETEIFS